MLWSLLAFCFLILFVLGILKNAGSRANYIFFSVTFLLLLISGFYKKTTYGYLFLVIFLWLGFWLKFTIHQIFTYPFGEPIGLFDGSSSAWDKVLLVASIGGIGVVAARVIYGRVGFSPTILSTNISNAPYWYGRNRKMLWFLLAVALAVCGTVNAIYGIQQSGLVPRTILMWPWNAVIYWMLSTGFAMGVATLLWWHIAFVKTMSLPAYMILGEAAISTLSLLSRGVYVFHAIPALVSLYINREHIKTVSVVRIFLYGLAFLALMFFSLSSVNMLRGYYYSDVPPVFVDLKGVGVSSGVFTKFVIERWVGLEGLMAISSYPNGGLDLFLDALTEKSEIGKSTLYQSVSLAHYRFMDVTRFQFASLPGAVAFFYYTNSLLLVFLGMMLLTLALLLSEKLVSCLAANPLLSSFWGCAMANLVAQFGVAPSGLIPYFIMNAVAVLAIKFIQSNCCSAVLLWIGQCVSVKA